MYAEGTDTLLIAKWNVNEVEVWDARKLTKFDSINVVEHAPYASLEIDQLQTCLL